MQKGRARKILHLLNTLVYPFLDQLNIQAFQVKTRFWGISPNIYDTTPGSIFGKQDHITAGNYKLKRGMAVQVTLLLFFERRAAPFQEIISKADCAMHSGSAA